MRAYADLKTGDRLLIRPAGIEIRVVAADGENLVIETSQGREHLYLDEKSHLGHSISLFNYGNRNIAGQTNHVRLNFNLRNVIYECIRIRGVRQQRLPMFGKETRFKHGVLVPRRALTFNR